MRHAVLPYPHKSLGIAFLLFMLLFGLWKVDLSYAQEERSPDLTKYLFADLNTFWNSTVGKTKPNAGWFKTLVLPNSPYRPLVPNPPSEPATSKQPTPPQNIILGTVNSGSTSQDNRLGFFVIPVSKNHRQELYKRLAAYEMYLNRYAAFDANSEATAVERTLLLKREKSAGIEMYLSYLLLYFSEPTLAKKCLRMKRFQEIAERHLPNLKKIDLLDDWIPLYDLFVKGKNKFSEDKLGTLACDIQPTQSRGEMQGKVTSQVRDRIHEAVHQEVHNTLELFKKTREKSQGLLGQSVPNSTTAIIEFERLLTDVQANLTMVKTDQLHAQSLIQTLQGKDFTQLQNDKNQEDFHDLINHIDQLKQSLSDMFSQLETVQDLLHKTSISSDLKTCQGLKTKIDGLDFSADAKTVRQTVVAPYEACLKAIATWVTSQITKQANAQNKIFQTFAKHVTSISDGLLAWKGRVKAR